MPVVAPILFTEGRILSHGLHGFLGFQSVESVQSVAEKIISYVNWTVLRLAGHGRRKPAVNVPLQRQASTSLCTVDAGIRSNWAFGFCISSIRAASAFHESGGVSRLDRNSRAASPMAPRVDKSWELASTSFTRKDRVARG